MGVPLFLDRGGHRTWLKWHRARRRAGDPVFSRTRILEGLRLGASVEVDLVIHGGHGFALLHDFLLDNETTGHGRARQTPPEALRELHRRSDDGTPLPDTVMLLEDLCALLAESPPAPGALLQLDVKEDLAALDAVTVTNFAQAVEPVSETMIVSGGDAAAIAALAGATPGLAIGHDPCQDDKVARLRATGDFAGFIGRRAGRSTRRLDDLPRARDHRRRRRHRLRPHRRLSCRGKAGGRLDHPAASTTAAVARCERLIALGVDQITTDDPEGLAAALSRTTSSRQRSSA